MRRFNPEKELNKIRNGNKNKIIIGLCTLLLIVVVGYSFALYQVRHTSKIVYTTVSDFSKDINLAIYVDNNKYDKKEFPSKEEGYHFYKVVCDNGSYWEFDNDNWELMLKTNRKDKCNIYFTKNYRDQSGANAPELYQGLIPIRFDEQNKMYIADVTKEWYDYDKHNWGNAVLIDNTDAEIRNKFYKEDGSLKVDNEITENDILQMYVWIPRYKYELFNAELGSVEPQMINIVFETWDKTTGTVSCSTAANGKETCINDKNGNWYTHPAFTFGDTELPGIWVGKFESSGTTDNLTIKPNATSLYDIQLRTIIDSNFNVEKNKKYNLNTNEIDTHMIKNNEWGAAVYLTNSKYGRYNDVNTCTSGGCEVWVNNNSNYTTGCGGDSANASQTEECNLWTSENGKHASTTDNLYGIYDMAGGRWEHVMGFTVTQDGNIDPYFKGISLKYYDLYEYSDERLTHERGHLGDATRETLTNFGQYNSSWYLESSSFPSQDDITFGRGGQMNQINISGVHYFHVCHTGCKNASRVVISNQDGNE